MGKGHAMTFLHTLCIVLNLIIESANFDKTKVAHVFLHMCRLSELLSLFDIQDLCLLFCTIKGQNRLLFRERIYKEG